VLHNILFTLQHVAHFFLLPVKNLNEIKFSVFSKFVISEDTASFTFHLILKIFAFFSPEKYVSVVTYLLGNIIMIFKPEV
jgi:hypothetical protein